MRQHNPVLLGAILALLSNPASLVRAQDPDDYTLRLSGATGLTGEFVTVRVFLDFPSGIGVAGIQLGVCASPGDASVVDNDCVGGVPPPMNDCLLDGVVAVGTALAATNNGTGPQLVAVSTQTVPSDGWTGAAVVNLLGQDFLPPQREAELFVVQYELRGPAGTRSQVTFCDLGDPVQFLAIGLAGGGDVVPASEAGSVTVGFGPRFIRGDVDGNGSLNGLADGLFLLNSAFVPNSPPPPCLESADIDGDGVVVGLFDALYGLGCHFLPGRPCPPPPFPRCGLDPDPASSLGCLDSPGCP